MQNNFPDIENHLEFTNNLIESMPPHKTEAKIDDVVTLQT